MLVIKSLPKVHGSQRMYYLQNRALQKRFDLKPDAKHANQNTGGRTKNQRGESWSSILSSFSSSSWMTQSGPSPATAPRFWFRGIKIADISANLVPTDKGASKGLIWDLHPPSNITWDHLQQIAHMIWFTGFTDAGCTARVTDVHSSCYHFSSVIMQKRKKEQFKCQFSNKSTNRKPLDWKCCKIPQSLNSSPGCDFRIQESDITRQMWREIQVFIIKTDTWKL